MNKNHQLLAKNILAVYAKKLDEMIALLSILSPFLFIILQSLNHLGLHPLRTTVQSLVRYLAVPTSIVSLLSVF